MKVWRNFTAAHCEHHLDQTGDAGGCLQMATGSSLPERRCRGRSAPRPRPRTADQRADLDRVAERGAGAVGLDVIDVGGFYPLRAGPR